MISQSKNICFISTNLVTKTFSLFSISNNMSDVALFLLEIKESSLATLEKWVCSLLIICIFNSGHYSHSPNVLKKTSLCRSVFYILLSLNYFHFLWHEFTPKHFRLYWPGSEYFYSCLYLSFSHRVSEEFKLLFTDVILKGWWIWKSDLALSELHRYEEYLH